MEDVVEVAVEEEDEDEAVVTEEGEASVVVIVEEEASVVATEAVEEVEREADVEARMFEFSGEHYFVSNCSIENS